VTDNVTDSKWSQPTAIVGIGSASGGIEPIGRILGQLDRGLGAAIVIAHHIDTSDSDVLVDLISPQTPLPVTALGQEPVRPEADHIYLVPPRSLLRVVDEKLAAEETEDLKQRASIIDDMFSQIAAIADDHAIGIVLSGIGTDGTYGLVSIREVGGMTIVQNPDSAQQDEMPRNAASNADHILDPAQIAKELSEHIRHLVKASNAAQSATHDSRIEANLPQICDALLSATEYEFRHYKKQTLLRRIARRMQVLRIDNADGYLQTLRQDRDEAHALFRELLVSVTAFFRDPDTFTTLSELVLPKLFENRSEGESIRIWVPGCATGEEAYTLAMLLIEERDKQKSDIDIQIFATDIDQRALNTAREGAYPASIASKLTKPRLDRFFKKSGKQYIVTKHLRDMCVFSIHNLVSDPPYSQMDLISCRNLLIYLGQPLQLKLIPLFHFALRPQGYLLLGPSENLTSHTEIFRPVDKKHRISQRKAGPAKPNDLFTGSGRASLKLSHAATNSVDKPDVHQISQRIVLDEFAPRYAVVNEDGHLVCTSTGLERFFAFPDGTFANNVVRIAKTGLRSGLRAALRESRESLRTVVRDDLTLKTPEGVQRIQLTVQPMPEIGEDTGLFMLVFHERGPLATRADHDLAPHDNEHVIEQLERELDRTRLDLESTVQHLEGSNEELKSSNEELRSLNEELQSANEELETSK